MNDDLWTKIKECVSQKQEERGEETPISFEEISQELGVDEHLIYEEVALRSDEVGLDLFIRIND